MIFLAHFTFNDLSEIHLIIWIAKRKVKINHELLITINKKLRNRKISKTMKFQLKTKSRLGKSKKTIINA